MRAEPQLFVSDIAVSCDFYKSKLGFDVAFTHGDPPFYAQVQRGKASLNLRLVSEPVFAGAIREREQLLSATIAVKSAKEITKLFKEYERAGVSFATELEQQPWGATTFGVSDPDGNVILFAGPATER